jgi:hypothetical protein
MAPGLGFSIHRPDISRAIAAGIGVLALGGEWYSVPSGRQVGTRFIDVSPSRNSAGTLFGLAVAPEGSGVYFVDDGDNTLNLLH